MIQKLAKALKLQTPLTNKPPYSAVFSSPLGNLGIRLQGDELTGLEFITAAIKPVIPDSALVRQVIQQLQDYFSNPCHQFQLPLAIHGTSYQKRVWQALLKIPVGNVLNYGALAQQLNTSARAIGNACRANPLPIIIPCHRIVGKSSWGGYNGQRVGQQIDVKCWLLQHEGVSYISNQGRTSPC
jgi:methylated-DNA-[protein]-cysteine S-methyltransferase